MNALTNQLDERNARKLCARINSGLEDVTNLVYQLYKGKGWAAIGYTSWTECCREEFGKSASWASRQVKLLGKIGSLDASLSCEDSQPAQAKTFIDNDPIDVRSTEPDEPADDATEPDDDPLSGEAIQNSPELSPEQDPFDEVVAYVLKWMTRHKKPSNIVAARLEGLAAKLLGE